MCCVDQLNPQSNSGLERLLSVCRTLVASSFFAIERLRESSAGESANVPSRLRGSSRLSGWVSRPTMAQGSSEPAYAATAIMSSMPSVATTGCIGAPAGVARLPTLNDINWRKR